MSRKQTAATSAFGATPKAWRNLTLTFGLVSAPVSIGALVQDTKPKGHILCDAHKQRINKHDYCEVCAGRPESTVKAYEHGGELVVLSENDIEDCCDVPSGEVSLTGCVYAGEVDPVWIETSYLIWPQKSKGASDAYALLTKSLRDSGKALVGTTVLTKSTRTLVLRWSPATETLVAHLCYPGAALKSHEVGMVKTVSDDLTAAIADDSPAMELTAAILDGLATEYDPVEVRDSYAEAMNEAIEAKALKRPARKGKKAAPVSTDAMLDALRASVEAIKAEKVAA